MAHGDGSLLVMTLALTIPANPAISQVTGRIDEQAPALAFARHAGHLSPPRLPNLRSRRSTMSKSVLRGAETGLRGLALALRTGFFMLLPCQPQAKAAVDSCTSSRRRSSLAYVRDAQTRTCL